MTAHYSARRSEFGPARAGGQTQSRNGGLMNDFDVLSIVDSGKPV